MEQTSVIFCVFILELLIWKAAYRTIVQSLFGSFITKWYFVLCFTRLVNTMRIKTISSIKKHVRDICSR